MADSNLKVMDEGIRALLYNRFKTIMGFTDMNKDTIIYPREVAQRIIAEKRGDVSLEFISLWRTGVKRYPRRLNTSVARTGLPLSFDDPTGKTAVRTVKAMPVLLEYSILFWSKDKDILNKAIESMLFWPQEDPNMNLVYNSSFPLEYDLLFTDISDESTVPNKFDEGQYFMTRTGINVEGFVFGPETLVKTIKTIHLKCYDDVDPSGAHEKDVLLFSDVIS